MAFIIVLLLLQAFLRVKAMLVGVSIHIKRGVIISYNAIILAHHEHGVMQAATGILTLTVIIVRLFVMFSLANGENSVL